MIYGIIGMPKKLNGRMSTLHSAICRDFSQDVILGYCFQCPPCWFLFLCAEVCKRKAGHIDVDLVLVQHRENALWHSCPILYYFMQWRPSKTPSPIFFNERVTFWLQRVRSLPCACAHVALFASRLAFITQSHAHTM